MKYKLKDVAIIKRGSSPRPINDFIAERGYPWLKISDFSLYDRYVYETHEFIREEGLKKTRYVKSGTLVVTNSATPGIPIFLGIDMCLHDGFLYFENISNKINKNYLYYYLINSRKELVQLGNGSVFVNLKKELLENFEIDLPSLDYQIKISSFLSTIDDKIELNNKINDNLQQQAKNIYEKSLAENEVNYCYLSELGCIKGGKRLPKGTNLTNKPNNHPYIRVRDLNNVIFLTLNNEYEYVDDETQKKISRYITNTGDVIISIVGTIGLTAIVDNTLNNANLTENCVKICNLNKVSSEYLLMYLRSNDGLASLNAGTVGAVQPKLPIKNIQDIKIPIIKDDVMKELNKELHVIFEKISSNMIETKKLSELRDTLLPKLMLGEIDVSNIKLDL